MSHKSASDALLRFIVHEFKNDATSQQKQEIAALPASSQRNIFPRSETSASLDFRKCDIVAEILNHSVKIVYFIHSCHKSFSMPPAAPLRCMLHVFV